MQGIRIHTIFKPIKITLQFTLRYRSYFREVTTKTDHLKVFNKNTSSSQQWGKETRLGVGAQITEKCCDWRETCSGNKWKSCDNSHGTTSQTLLATSTVRWDVLVIAYMDIPNVCFGWCKIRDRRIIAWDVLADALRSSILPKTNN